MLLHGAAFGLASSSGAISAASLGRAFGGRAGSGEKGSGFCACTGDGAGAAETISATVVFVRRRLRITGTAGACLETEAFLFLNACVSRISIASAS